MFDRLNNTMVRVYGQTVTIAGSDITAIVNLPRGGRDIGGGMIVDKTEPSIDALTSDLNLITFAKGSAVAIGSASYIVQSILPDEYGLTTIIIRPV